MKFTATPTMANPFSYFSYAPLRGEDSIIPENPYQAILDGAGKDDPDFCLL